MLTRFLRDQAWWRLDSPGVNAIRTARSVVALLDTAICLEGLPDNHPDLKKLARAGCFRNGVFDPGEAGLAVVRGWELADQPTVHRQDLLAALAFTVGPQHPARAPVSTAPPEAVCHEAAPRSGVHFPSDPQRGQPLEGALLTRPPTGRVPPLTGQAPRAADSPAAGQGARFRPRLSRRTTRQSRPIHVHGPSDHATA